MIKHLFARIIKNRKRLFIPTLVLFLSFFVLSIIIGYIYPDIVKSSTLKLSVPTNNRVELFFEWAQEDREIRRSIETILKEGVLKLDGVLAADYVINDLGSIHSMHTYDQTFSNTYLVTCGEDFIKVFDLKLKQGRWFADTEIFMNIPPAIITQNHADLLGIDNINQSSFLTIAIPKGNTLDSTKFQIIGILGNFENVRDIFRFQELAKNVFPIFTPAPLFEQYDPGAERLILKMQKGYDFKTLDTHILKLIEETQIGKYIFQYRLTSFNNILFAQIKEHFRQLNMFYSFLLILLIYIFVALFGTFWKLTHKRTIEIGIRRAVGHSRRKVIFYILAEPLLLFMLSMIPATLVFLNLYKLFNVKSPTPVYIITVGILLFVVILATLVPVIYTGRIHPVQALAEE